MNFKYDASGTARQIALTREAIGDCSFPTDRLRYINVTVKWQSPLPASDTKHSYMVTQTSDGVNFTIYVESWADDASHPELAGLPNPARDIYDYYKQSFVHELGHVVSFAMLTNDSLITKICNLYWRNEADSGPGRRYGVFNDWQGSGLAWADLIKEAVAETFKVAFYTQRLIFANRTNWNLDKDKWRAWLDLLTPLVQTGLQAQFVSNPDHTLTYDLPWTATGNTDQLVLDSGKANLNAHGLDVALVGSIPAVFEVTSTYVRINRTPTQAFIGSGPIASVGAGTIGGYFIFDTILPSLGKKYLSFGNSDPANTELPDLTDFWIGARLLDDGTNQFGLWIADPTTGAAPLYSINKPQNLPGSAGMSFDTVGLDDKVSASEWTINGQIVNVPLDAPYPFVPPGIQFGDNGTGVVRPALLGV